MLHTIYKREKNAPLIQPFNGLVTQTKWSIKENTIRFCGFFLLMLVFGFLKILRFAQIDHNLTFLTKNCTTVHEH
jgi:hypothetical protein